jgi:hypothetical protein
MMKQIMLAAIAALTLSACTAVVYTPQPVQYCRWVEIPVYGVVDIYRTKDTTVRVQQVAHVDRQWRCN